MGKNDYDEGVLLRYLEEIASNEKNPKFIPGFYYCGDGDFVDACWKEDECYGEYINSEITLMRSEKDGSIVGVQLFGILQQKEKRRAQKETETKGSPTSSRNV